MEKTTNFYNEMLNFALQAVGESDMIDRYDLQFNWVTRAYTARVTTVRGKCFDVVEEPDIYAFEIKNVEH